MASRPPLRALLLDLSGTLHISSAPTPRAPSALQKLRASGIPFRFCTNTSKESSSDLLRRLGKMGFEGVKRDDVWGVLSGVKGLLALNKIRRPYFILTPSAISECTQDLDVLQDSSIPYDAVVIGLAPEKMNYEHLNEAFRILSMEHPSSTESSSAKKPILITTSLTQYIRVSDSHLSLGPGPFVKALEVASGVQAVSVGKPGKQFFEGCVRSMRTVEGEGEHRGRVAIIGDDVENDLGSGAIELGFWRVLVKTGKYRPGDEFRPGIVPPDEVVNSFAEWVDMFLEG